MRPEVILALSVLPLIVLSHLVPPYNPNQAQFDGTVTFVVHLEDNTVLNVTGVPNAATLVNAGCNTENWMIFSHGWGGSCYLNDWVPTYIALMKRDRGGCIICFDYYNYSVPPPYSTNYFALTRYFPNIVTTVKNMLVSMKANGFNFAGGYGYGFSFGAQVILTAIYIATQGSREIPVVDFCEKAGVGDGYYLNINKLPDPRLTAQHVSCIHTSTDKGDTRLDCHQNWRMGKCGSLQAASGPPPMGHHGLCPYFWNCAFDYDFPAIQNPYKTTCPNTTDVNPPAGLQFGYPWKDTSVSGNLYAMTGKNNCYSTT